MNQGKPLQQQGGLNPQGFNNQSGQGNMGQKGSGQNVGLQATSGGFTPNQGPMGVSF
jgi:hypothetical protein